MKSISYKLIPNSGYEPCEPKEATHLMFNLPGPIMTHILPVMIGGTRQGTPNWTWNGNIDLPTLKPSIKSTNGKDITHCWLNDGKVIFLEDCSHELKGQTLDLLDIEI